MNDLLELKIMPENVKYYYDLEKVKKYVIENDGIWEMDEPPCALVVYLYGTIVRIGNDYPFICFESDIEVARKIHHIGMIKS